MDDPDLLFDLLRKPKKPPHPPCRTLPAWPQGRYNLRADHLWLYASNDRSWDSRYCGPVRTTGRYRNGVAYKRDGCQLTGYAVCRIRAVEHVGYCKRASCKAFIARVLTLLTPNKK